MNVQSFIGKTKEEAIIKAMEALNAKEEELVIAEKDRIEKAGGSIYKDDIVTLNGEKVRMTEENLPANFTLPYRIIPGNISVSST